MITCNKSLNSNNLKECSNTELLERAERPINGGNSLYNGGFTVITSDKLYEKEYKIKGKVQKGVVFLGACYDNNNQFVRQCEISPNSFTRELCPNQGNAVGSIRQVVNCGDYGNSAKEIVNNMVQNNLCIKFKETLPLGAPNFDSAAGRMDYSNMTIRERSTYEITQCPQAILDDLQKA